MKAFYHSILALAVIGMALLAGPVRSGADPGALDEAAAVSAYAAILPASWSGYPHGGHYYGDHGHYGKHHRHYYGRHHYPYYHYPHYPYYGGYYRHYYRPYPGYYDGPYGKGYFQYTFCVRSGSVHICFNQVYPGYRGGHGYR